MSDMVGNNVESEKHHIAAPSDKKTTYIMFNIPIYQKPLNASKKASKGVFVNTFSGLFFVEFFYIVLY